MLNPIDPRAALRQPQEPLPADAVNNVFKVLHGFYGNLFLSKFATGEVENGEDRGVVSARQVWGHGLREFDVGTVKTALSRCITHHPEFPPSMPQFVALCAASKPREVYKPIEQPALAMSEELREERRAAERKRLEELAARIKAQPPESGLTLLKQAIAQAVACGGGDEAAALRRLDLLLARKEAA